MKQNYFTSTIWHYTIILLLPLLIAFNGNAQTEQQIIQSYLNGTLEITTSQQKEIISRYLDENREVPFTNQFSSNIPIETLQERSFFSEDFNTTTPGDTYSTTPPAGWQIVNNPGGNVDQQWTFYHMTYNPGNTAWTTPSGGGFDGSFVVVNSDLYGSGQTQNTSLITPPINATGRTDVHLSFSEQFRHFTGSTVTLSVSIDGGTNWTELFSRTATYGHPNPALVTLIPVPQANNQADVRFMWTFNATWGYWWAIDNVVVMEGSPLSPLPAGVYPINGVDNPPTSFENITTAAAYLALNGITGTGQVVFELSTGYAGTEPGPVTIGEITGASSTLGVTFRPATGYTAVTEVVGGASPNQHALALAGASYVTLDGRQGGAGTGRDWTVRVTGTTNAQMAVRLQNNSASMTDITVRNLIMEAAAASVTGAIFQITGVSGNTIQNVTVENNMIRSIGTASPEIRGYGITVAVATNAGNTGLIVRNNDIVNVYARGMNITAAYPGAEYYGNRIYHTADITQPSATEFSGIYYSSTSVNGVGTKIYGNMVYDIRLTNNTITATTGVNGIYINNTPTSGDRIQFYNNVVSIGQGLTGTAATANVYGIRDNSAATNIYDLYYNSVYVGGLAPSGANNSAAFYKQLSNGINLANNSFFNARGNDGGTGVHWAIRANNTTFESIGNNNYFVSGVDGVLGTSTGVAAGNTPTLADWKTAVPSDLTSVSQNPNYLNATASPPDLNINPAIQSQLESGGVEIAGITTDFAGTSRFPNAGHPFNPSYPASAPDIGAYEFAGQPLDLTPPVINVVEAGNTSSTVSHTVVAEIFDPSGIDSAANAPRLYFRKQQDPSFVFSNATSVVGDDYTFTFTFANIGGVTPGDTIVYYVGAQDQLGNAGTSPGGGSGANPPGTTPPPTLYSFIVVPPPLAGDYTVGISTFNLVSGFDVSFETRTRIIEKEIYVNDQELNPELYETPVPEVRITPDGQVIMDEVTEPAIPQDHLITVSFEETYYVPVVNGDEYKGSLYYELNDAQRSVLGVEGVYATIGAAVNDAQLRGVGSAVRFLLTDATYPSETFPIVFTNINGLSSSNTLTVTPAAGVTATVASTVLGPVFRLSNISNIIFDGRQNGTGTPGSLIVNNSSTTSTTFNFDLIDGSSDNIIQYCVMNNSAAATAGSAGVRFSTSAANPSGNSDNLIYGNTIIGGRSGILMSGTAANPNDGNVIDRNSISDFGFTGVWLSASSNNTTVHGNDIFNSTAGINVAHSGINIGTVLGVNEISGNKIFDLQNTSTTTIRGITMTGGVGSVWNVFNNFFSFTNDNGTKTSIYAFQNSGTNAIELNFYYNTFMLGGSHTGGTAGQIISCGYVKGNSGADAIHRYKNNIVLNTRTGGTSGTFHVGTFVGSIAGTLDIDYNAHWADGSASSFSAGWIGTVYNAIADYKTAAAPHEQNSIFKATNFVSNTDLHLTGASIGDMDLAGTPIAGITVDIDGDERNTIKPYMGADEADVPLYQPPMITLWERSVADASLPTWFGTNTERGIAYGLTQASPSLTTNERVFVVSRSDGIKVRILNADTGADVGELNTTGITGGTFALNDVEVTSDGIILACNLTTDATTSPFKIYMWANEGSVPAVVFSYTAADAVRLGDNFSVIGNYLAGTAEIWAASATAGQGKIYKWTMTGGSFNAVPEIITLSDNAAGGSAAVGPLANGDFYWNAGGHSAKKYSANGTLIGTIPGGVVATGSNAIVFLGSIGTDEYVATYQYGAGNHNARVVLVPEGMPDSASTYGLTESMGSAANVGGTGDVAVKHNPDGSKDIFVLGTNNGVGAFRSTQSIPVELSLFTAAADGRDVQLNWRTITESNTAGFEVERRIGSEWNQVGYVVAAGNSTEPVNYNFVDSDVNAGTYGYRLRIVDLDGTFAYSPEVEVEVGVPMVYAMSQNYPNPFNPTTRISYQLPMNAKVTITLYSITGERVAMLVNEELTAGYHTLDVDASSLRLASGVYLYRMIATDLNGSNFIDSKKMMMLK